MENGGMMMDFQIKTKDDVLNLVQEKNVVFIRLQFVDILGTPKNIVIPAGRLEEAFDDGMPLMPHQLQDMQPLKSLIK